MKKLVSPCRPSRLSPDRPSQPTFRPGPTTKAPVMVAPPSWTGFYIFGGVGGGIWDADSNVSDPSGRCRAHPASAHGWRRLVRHRRCRLRLAVQPDLGCRCVRRRTVRQPPRHHRDPFVGVPGSGNEKLRDTWAAGVRLGCLVAPNVLSYVNGGYTGSHWSGSTLTPLPRRRPDRAHTNSFTRNGWFIGGGVENSLNIFGITLAGLVHEDRISRCLFHPHHPSRIHPAGVLDWRAITFKPWVQTSAPRWSTASTGPVRSLRSTDLELALSSKSPGIVRGFFVPGFWLPCLPWPMPAPRGRNASCRPCPG